MTRQVINTLAALALAALLSTSYLLDGPDDIATEQAVVNDLRQAQLEAQRQAQINNQQLAIKTIATEAYRTQSAAVFVKNVASAEGAPQ